MVNKLKKHIIIEKIRWWILKKYDMLTNENIKKVNIDLKDKIYNKHKLKIKIKSKFGNGILTQLSNQKLNS